MGALGMALLQVLIPIIAPKIGTVIVAALGAMERKFDAMALTKDDVNDHLWPTALAIVRGINADHPDWPGPQKAEYARDAIRHLLVRYNKNPNDQAINWIIESAVNVEAQS